MIVNTPSSAPMVRLVRLGVQLGQVSDETVRLTMAKGTLLAREIAKRECIRRALLEDAVLVGLRVELLDEGLIVTRSAR